MLVHANGNIFHYFAYDIERIQWMVQIHLGFRHGANDVFALLEI
jgi:hypothetical protein